MNRKKVHTKEKIMNNLEKFNDWSQNPSNYFAKRSAQSYMIGNHRIVNSANPCGSSCGSGDGNKVVSKFSPCGSGGN
ncbi:hypothetical protein [Methanospirillum sp.]|uniref:hypothetical protein n=1 Tax=Methanospirillum sp. TaxID=45200 RepID=UPI0035A0898E